MKSSLPKFALIAVSLVYLYIRVQHESFLDESYEAQIVRLGSKVVASDLLKRGRLWRDVTGGGERLKHNSLSNRPHWFLDALLLLAGDIELNPGPKNRRGEVLEGLSSKKAKLDEASSSSESDEFQTAPFKRKAHKKLSAATQPIITPIRLLNPFMNEWTIKARVLSKPYLKRWEKAYGKGHVLKLYLADETGEIKVFAFNEVALEVCSKLKAGKVYLISGGSIKPANQKYSNLKHDFELQLDKDTDIEMCQDDQEIQRCFRYTFTEIADIEECEAGSVVDVTGICVKSSSLEKTRHATLGHEINKRDIKLTDSSGGNVLCTLYESDAEDFDGSSNPVVAIKAAEVSKVSNEMCSIKTGYSSAISINPPLPKTKELQDWYQSTIAEDYLQLYNQALDEEKKVRLGIIQCMVVGPPQVGKTKLKKRLVGETCNSDDASTGVADKPYVVVHTVHMNKADWTLLHFDNEKSLFFQRLDASTESINMDNAEHDCEQSDSPDEGISSQMSKSLEKRPTNPHSTGGDVSSSVDDAYQMTDKVPYEEFITALMKDSQQAEALPEMDIENGCMIYFTDTGGQLEFQEVLPSIISGPAIFMIVFNLEEAATLEGLDKKFKVKYKSRDGKVYNWGSDHRIPTMSTKELILQTLASICSIKHAYTIGGREIRPKVMLIGTHLDKLKEDHENAIKKVNSELKKLLEQTDYHLNDILVYPSEDEDDYFFKVNNELADHPTFDEIRRKVESIAQVGQENSDYVEDVPFSWLAFDLRLRMSEHQLLNLSMCVEIAKNCGTKTKDVVYIMGILQRRFGVIRYIEHLDLVVTNPQVIYDSITNLVVESFCKNDGGGPTRGECKTFKEKGLIPVGALKRFHNEKIIPLKVLLKLLDHLHIVVTVKEDENGEASMYFMPCILAHAPSANTEPQVQPCIAELIVAFRYERCPKGVFSTLLATLAKLRDDRSDKSAYKWKLKLDDPQVTLYRNQISFEVFEPNEQYSSTVYITVSDCIAISIRPLDQALCAKSTACNNVYKTVKKSMESVCKSLNYKDSEYYFGFYCKKRHIAKCSGDSPRQMLCAKCKKDASPDFKLPLEDKHLHWFRTTQDPDVKSSGQTQGSSRTDTESTTASFQATGISTDFHTGKGLSDPPTKLSFSTTFWGIHDLKSKCTLGVEPAKNDDGDKMEVDSEVPLGQATKIIRTPVIAILDTGIYKEHAAFTKDGHCKVMEESRSYIDGDTSIEDSDGHGTACAGIAAGFAFPVDSEVTFPGGVAFNANLIICRVAKDIKRSKSQHDSVASALSALIKLNSDHETDKGIPYVDVVSMSFYNDSILSRSKDKIKDQWSDLITKLKSQGTICVAAAGNSGDREGVKYPAFLGDVISVGSHDRYGRLSNSSQAGANVYALGVDVCSPENNKENGVPDHSNKRGVQCKSGSSTAAPAVAGLIARLIEYGHFHFGNDIQKLRWLHNSDMMLNKILKTMHHGKTLMLHPKEYFEEDFGIYFDKAVGKK